MKYKLITEMTDDEIEFLWKDIFQVNKVVNIERRPEDNEIEVTFETTWECEDEEIKAEDTIIMYSDNFEEPNFSISGDDKLKYKQYMIAKGYSRYWKDNPYIYESSREELLDKTCKGKCYLYNTEHCKPDGLALFDATTCKSFHTEESFKVFMR